MNIYIGENIKRLRHEKNITQEALSDILSISPQSVSKWEREESFPDITMLPAIANYFGVTIDALLGNDKILTEERIQKYISDYKKANDSDEFPHEIRKKSIDIAEKAYREFSYDFRIVMLYANALNIYGDDNKNEKIKHLCNMVLDNCNDEKLRADAAYFLKGMISAKDKMDFLKKYIEYNQPADWLKIYPLSSEEGKIMWQHEIFDKWWHLNMYIYMYGDSFNEEKDCHVSHENKIKLIKKCEKIFYAFFEEDDLWEFTFYVGQYNEFLALEYLALGMTEEALEHFEKSVDGWIQYNHLPKEHTYKNILINHRPCTADSLNGAYTFPSRYIKDIDSNQVYDLIRDHPKFKTAYQRLFNEK